VSQNPYPRSDFEVSRRLRPVASALRVKHRLPYSTEACHSGESADEDRRDAADRSAQPLAAGSHYYLGPIPLDRPNHGPGDFLWGARTGIPRQGDPGLGEHARVADICRKDCRDADACSVQLLSQREPESA
jgi:hypothetical protein